MAGIGPVSIRTGSLPTTLIVRTRARTVSPWRRTAASEAISSAAAPSEIWLATPAVRTPPSLSGLSAASFSADVSGRGPSSCARPAAGTISSTNKGPAVTAR